MWMIYKVIWIEIMWPWIKLTSEETIQCTVTGSFYKSTPTVYYINACTYMYNCTFKLCNKSVHWTLTLIKKSSFVLHLILNK